MLGVDFGHEVAARLNLKYRDTTGVDIEKSGRACAKECFAGSRFDSGGWRTTGFGPIAKRFLS